MKERFDPKTEDIFLFLSQEELDNLLGNWNAAGIILKNPQKKAAFFLFGEDIDRYIVVDPMYNVPAVIGGREETFTNYYIQLSKAACLDLKERRVCRDRYLGTTGGEKISIFLGEPDQIEIQL